MNEGGVIPWNDRYSVRPSSSPSRVRYGCDLMHVGTRSAGFIGLLNHPRPAWWSPRVFTRRRSSSLHRRLCSRGARRWTEEPLRRSARYQERAYTSDTRNICAMGPREDRKLPMYRVRRRARGCGTELERYEEALEDVGSGWPEKRRP